MLGSPSGVIGLALLSFHVCMAIAAPLIVPHGPTAIHPDRTFLSPGPGHPFGTDQLGRDVLSRVLMGGRAALTVSLVATGLAILAGGLAGMALGYKGGLADEAALRLVDSVQAIPGLLFYLSVVTVLGSGHAVLVVALAFTNVPGVLRVARSATLQQVEREYVAAARARGESTGAIVVREILPNVGDVLLLEFAMRASWMVLGLSALSFLGFGVGPPTPDWGSMVAENRSRLAIAPWATLFPAAAIATLVIGLNLAADALARSMGLDRAPRGTA